MLPESPEGRTTAHLNESGRSPATSPDEALVYERVRPRSSRRPAAMPAKTLEFGKLHSITKMALR